MVKCRMALITCIDMLNDIRHLHLKLVRRDISRKRQDSFTTDCEMHFTSEQP